VLQLATDLGLLDESFEDQGVVAMFFAQNFDGNFTSQVGIPAAENRTHSAAGDFAEYLVSAGAAGRRCFPRVWLLDDSGIIGNWLAQMNRPQAGHALSQCREDTLRRPESDSESAVEGIRRAISGGAIGGRWFGQGSTPLKRNSNPGSHEQSFSRKKTANSQNRSQKSFTGFVECLRVAGLMKGDDCP
jgi:hypothetical protein